MTITEGNRRLPVGRRLARLAMAVQLGAGAHASASSPKLGWAGGNADDQNAANASWYYNGWHTTPSPGALGEFAHVAGFLMEMRIVRRGFHEERPGDTGAGGGDFVFLRAEALAGQRGNPLRPGIRPEFVEDEMLVGVGDRDAHDCSWVRISCVCSPSFGEPSGESGRSPSKRIGQAVVRYSKPSPRRTVCSMPST